MWEVDEGRLKMVEMQPGRSSHFTQFIAVLNVIQRIQIRISLLVYLCCVGVHIKPLIKPFSPIVHYMGFHLV